MDVHNFVSEIISSIVVLLLFSVARFWVSKIVRRFSMVSEILEHRTNLVIKYIQILIGVLAFIALSIIWGVQAKDLFLAISSISAVIGVALFAQWSILSNVTAGIILFFSFPFKIGDVIKIHDKDFPIEAEIEDIKAFHALLKTKTGERITYPNNLLLQKGISIVPSEEFTEKEFTD